MFCDTRLMKSDHSVKSLNNLLYAKVILVENPGCVHVYVFCVLIFRDAVGSNRQCIGGRALHGGGN